MAPAGVPAVRLSSRNLLSQSELPRRSLVLARPAPRGVVEARSHLPQHRYEDRRGGAALAAHAARPAARERRLTARFSAGSAVNGTHSRFNSELQAAAGHAVFLV